MYSSIIESKLVKAFSDILKEIPFFKNFFDLKDDLKDLGKDVIDGFLKMKNSVYTSNKAYMKNSLQLILLRGKDYLNEDTGYWLNQILVDNLDNNKSSKKLKESLEFTLSEYKHKGNPTITPVHPFQRQFVERSKINKKKVYQYNKGDKVYLIIDNRINKNVYDVKAIRCTLDSGVYDLGARKVVDVVYNFEGEERKIKIFLDSYRLWGLNELKLINNTDKTTTEAYYDLLIKNFKNYQSNNSSENVSEANEVKTPEHLNKTNFIPILKRIIKEDKSDDYYEYKAMFDSNSEKLKDKFYKEKNKVNKYKEEIDKKLDTIKNTFNTFKGVSDKDFETWNKFLDNMKADNKYKIDTNSHGDNQIDLDDIEKDLKKLETNKNVSPDGDNINNFNDSLTNEDELKKELMKKFLKLKSKVEQQKKNYSNFEYIRNISRKFNDKITNDIVKKHNKVLQSIGKNKYEFNSKEYKQNQKKLEMLNKISKEK